MFRYLATECHTPHAMALAMPLQTLPVYLPPSRDEAEPTTINPLWSQYRKYVAEARESRHRGDAPLTYAEWREANGLPQQDAKE